MENTVGNVQMESSFSNNPEIHDYLVETSKWGKFLAIMGYIGIGLLVLISIIMMVGLSRMSNISGVNFPMGMLGLIYIVIAVLYFFPVNYLYQFSVKIRKGLNSKDLPAITEGFRNLKSLFKFMGILTIVIFSLYILILLFAVPTMLFLRHL